MVSRQWICDLVSKKKKILIRLIGNLEDNEGILVENSYEIVIV